MASMDFHEEIIKHSQFSLGFGVGKGTRYVRASFLGDISRGTSQALSLLCALCRWPQGHSKDMSSVPSFHGTLSNIWS